MSASPTQPLEPDLASIIATLHGPLAQLTSFLSEQVNEFEVEVHEAVEYAISHQGKRLRPVLAFYSGLQQVDKPASLELIKAAAIIELVHLATLVHDDIIDGATLRHQTETISTKYGPNFAVLLGDALFAHALTLTTDFEGNRVCREVSTAMRRVCSGEISQSLNLEDTEQSLAQYFRIIDMKTAELFSLSCLLGSYLSEDEPSLTQAKSNFGRNLGMAYQIFDDVVDIWGEEKAIGKTLGTDLNKKKFTLPVLLLLSKLDSDSRQAFIDEVLMDENVQNSRHKILEVMEEKQIGQLTLAYFRKHTDAAKSIVVQYPDASFAKPFATMVDYLEYQMHKILPA